MSGRKITLKQEDGVWSYNGSRKSVLALRNIGYTAKEISDTVAIMLAMTIDELKEIYEHPNSTALEKSIAVVIRKGIEKGSMFNIEILLSRAYGKPRESIEIKEESTKRVFSWHHDEEPPKQIEG